MSVRRRGWTAVLAAMLVTATAASAGAQHRPGNALNWAFGGTVHTVARAGHIAIVGGRFNAVAARHNVTGGFAAFPDGALFEAVLRHLRKKTPQVIRTISAMTDESGEIDGGRVLALCSEAARSPRALLRIFA